MSELIDETILDDPAPEPRGYLKAAIDHATANRWTSAQAAGATYSQISTACGIRPDKFGHPPRDFFYTAIRHKLASRLDRIEADEKAEAAKTEIVDLIKTASEVRAPEVSKVRRSETVEGPGYFVREGS